MSVDVAELHIRENIANDFDENPPPHFQIYVQLLIQYCG